jgi:hypothetical protein
MWIGSEKGRCIGFQPGGTGKCRLMSGVHEEDNDKKNENQDADER